MIDSEKRRRDWWPERTNSDANSSALLNATNLAFSDARRSQAKTQAALPAI